ncbi:MAG TPA: hypothetical protein EYO58_12710 [Flavobacteriales bacterium]|nr:hypothetical protein [Flavobacteriales bacterium]
MSKKYKVPVSTYVRVSKHAGYIECDSFAEYEKLLDEGFDKFMDDGHISTNVSNDFELDGCVEINELEKDDIKFYKLS